MVLIGNEVITLKIWFLSKKMCYFLRHHVTPLFNQPKLGVDLEKIIWKLSSCLILIGIVFIMLKNSYEVHEEGFPNMNTQERQKRFKAQQTVFYHDSTRIYFLTKVCSENLWKRWPQRNENILQEDRINLKWRRMLETGTFIK